LFALDIGIGESSLAGASSLPDHGACPPCAPVQGTVNLARSGRFDLTHQEVFTQDLSLYNLANLITVRCLAMAETLWIRHQVHRIFDTVRITAAKGE
jgi:hypothetical protein